jgi:hypothetical protein
VVPFVRQRTLLAGTQWYWGVADVKHVEPLCAEEGHATFLRLAQAMFLEVIQLLTFSSGSIAIFLI